MIRTPQHTEAIASLKRDVVKLILAAKGNATPGAVMARTGLYQSEVSAILRCDLRTFGLERLLLVAMALGVTPIIVNSVEGASHLAELLSRVTARVLQLEADMQSIVDLPLHKEPRHREPNLRARHIAIRSLGVSLSDRPIHKRKNGSA